MNVKARWAFLTQCLNALGRRGALAHADPAERFLEDRVLSVWAVHADGQVVSALRVEVGDRAKAPGGRLVLLLPLPHENGDLSQLASSGPGNLL